MQAENNTVRNAQVHKHIYLFICVIILIQQYSWVVCKVHYFSKLNHATLRCTTVSLTFLKQKTNELWSPADSVYNIAPAANINKETCTILANPIIYSFGTVIHLTFERY